MKRQEKEVVVAKMHERFSAAKVSILTDYSGMTVAEVQAVKNTLRKVKGEFRVVKNRLAMRAAKGTPLEKVSSHFKGPVALTLGFGDVVPPVKALDGLLGEQKKLKVKVGVIDGQVVDLAGFRAVAKLPGKEVLLGQLVVRMKSPLYGFAGALGGILSKMVRVLDAVKTARESSAK